MKPLHPSYAIFSAAVVLLAAPTLSAQRTVGEAVAAIQRERIQSSYLLTFGRTATEDEVKYWAKQNPKSVGELVQRHRSYLRQDSGTHTSTIKRSYVDAFGRNPNSGEIQHWSAGQDTYSELMQKHMQWLAGNPGEHESVIKRSYTFALGRAPTAAEIKYWKGQGAVSYAVLVAAHDDWKKRNGAAAQRTTGQATLSSNTSFLAAVPVSASVLGEIRASGIVAAGGGNIVAAGGGNIVAAGGGNIVAAGGGNLVAAGGGN